MDRNRGTFETIARHLALAVQPLRTAVADLNSFKNFLYRLGWKADSLPPSYSALGTLVNDVLQALDLIEGSPDEPDLSQVLNLLGKVKALYRAIVELSDAPDGVDVGAFLDEIRERIFELLLVDYLAAALPRVYQGLVTLGIITLESQGETDARPPYLRAQLHYDQAPKLISDPLAIPRQVYGWGTDDLDTVTLFGHLREILGHTGLFASFGLAPSDLVKGYVGSAASRSSLKFTLFETLIAGEPVEVAFQVLALPPDEQRKAGIIIQPVVPSSISDGYQITDRLTLGIRAGSNVDSIFGVLIRPDDISVRYPFAPDTPPPEAGFGIALVFKPDTATTLLGRPSATRLQLGGLTTGFQLNVNGSQVEVRLDLALDDLALVLKVDEQDGFIGRIFGNADKTIHFSLTVEWSSVSGIHFSGGVGFEFTSSPHLMLGPVSVDQLQLALRSTLDETQPPDLIIEVSATFSGVLGPFAFSIDKVGLRLAAVFQSGNAGPFNIEIAPKPPEGLGLVVDTEGITGGGFLSFDSKNGRYAGAVQLKIHDISVKAIGLLDTRLPGGESGFSFLIIISAEFQPIQLGLGFTLNGVGGLAGVNRTAVVEVLRAGLRNKTLDHILFPPDPVRDAPQIISDLRAVFPPAEGQYLFGPMAIIGWGNLSGTKKTLIEAEIGLVLEFPQPFRLLLLGQIQSIIEVEGKRILELHIDVFGLLDFNQKRLEIDATLRDSRVMGITLTGDAALRLKWGDDPVFVFSIGGFNPRFTPPPGFPALRRLTAVLGDGDNPKLTLELYLAVTSNTFQVGAKAELQAGGKYNVHGWISFDALIHFSPFSFIADISAGVDLRRNKKVLAGVHLSATLSGPSPWHVKGEACLSLWLFDVCVDFERTFGQRADFITTATVDLIEELKKAIADGRNWSASLPAAVERVVSTAPPKLPADTAIQPVLVDPMGAIALHQRLLPLNHRIAKFGEAVLAKPETFTVKSVAIGGGAAKEPSLVNDFFAPGQFEVLSDDQKLSRESFVKMAAGVAAASDALRHGPPKETTVTYEEFIIDEPDNKNPFALPGVNLLGMLGRSAATQGGFLTTGARKFAPALGSAAFVSLIGSEYVVVSATDLSRRADISPATNSSAAAIALANYLASHPEEKGQLQVVPLGEI